MNNKYIIWFKFLKLQFDKYKPNFYLIKIIKILLDPIICQAILSWTNKPHQ